MNKYDIKHLFFVFFFSIHKSVCFTMPVLYGVTTIIGLVHLHMYVHTHTLVYKRPMVLL